MEEIKEEYVKPLIHVLRVGDLMQQDFPVSNNKGSGGITAKPFMEDDEEDVEADKWGTTLPTNVPDAWKQVGE